MSAEFSRRSGKLVEPRSQGFTLLEMLVVLVLLGLMAGLVAPAFLSPPSVPDDALQRVIDQARRTAVQRAEAVTLSFTSDGGWTVAGGGASDSLRILAGTLARPSASLLRIRVSPLGACTLDAAQMLPTGFSIDPVRCRLRAK